MSPEQTAAAAAANAYRETPIQRSAHPDFKQVEASRPAFDAAAPVRYVQTPCPDWTFGGGANRALTAAERARGHVAIDPYGAGRGPAANYRLLTSAVVPRPLAFLSTRSADGGAANVAPFSFFQLINHDPPLFALSFTGGRDSLRNLRERGECVVNLVGEGTVEAANAASVDAPYGVSEWDLCGLTPVYDCETVGVARAREAVFAVEGRLESLREFESRAEPGKISSTLAIIEGTRFWVREDAVNEERTFVKPEVRLVLRQCSLR